MMNYSLSFALMHHTTIDKSVKSISPFSGRSGRGIACRWKVKHKRWRASPAICVRKAAPVLEFAQVGQFSLTWIEVSPREMMMRSCRRSFSREAHRPNARALDTDQNNGDGEA